MQTRKIKSALFIVLMAIPTLWVLPQPMENTITKSSEGEFTVRRPRSRVLEKGTESDADFDRIEDSLEELIDTATIPEQKVRVIVILSKGYEEKHLNVMRELGDVIHTYEHAMNGFAALIPLNKIRTLSERIGPQLKIIVQDYPIQLHLDKSVRIIRARNFTWSTYGYKGSPDFSIAILDTGIDDSHLDLYGYQDQGWDNPSVKIVGWKDTTTDGDTSPVDYQSHGTHVASTAAGTGSSYSNGTISNITITFSGIYPGVKGSGWFDFVDVPCSGNVTIKMYHYAPIGGPATGWISLRYANNTLLVPIDGNYETSDGVNGEFGTNNPLWATYNVTTPGIYKALSGQNDARLRSKPFSTLEMCPYRDVGDGYNLLTGTAPENRLVGVKIFENDGDGYTSDMLEAFDWIIANKETYRIKVASMSAGIAGGTSLPSLSDAANNVVANGIVFAVSAGNGYPDYEITDPALASKVITVAATNEYDQIADYSSNGPAGSSKPDVAAPGGSGQVGRQITAADTNDNDADTVGFPDYNPNDYTNMVGTSMSTPQVAGQAALVIQALESLGYVWSYTEQDALKVKMLILMTAIETNQNGESNNNPSLERGGKDLVEGYGRINVDAAIEAASITWNPSLPESATLCASDSYTRTQYPDATFRRHVWARKISLVKDYNYSFVLDVPSTGDFDLYIYSDTPNTYGEPVIKWSSTQAGVGVDENIATSYLTAEEEGTYYYVVKAVSGYGTFYTEYAMPPVYIPELPIGTLVALVTAFVVAAVYRLWTKWALPRWLKRFFLQKTI